MKRRQFLITSSAGVAGLLPLISRGEVKPCPPPSLSLAGGTSSSTSCVPPNPGTAPSWFLNMPEKTWVQASTNTLDSVKPPNLPEGATGHKAVCVAWTGGCVDPVRGELILAANGGHNDYYGNEVYAIQLKSESPKWVRLTDPSPASAITLQGSGAGNSQYAYTDGRPRAVHGWNRCVFAKGQVWYPGLTGMAAGNSGSSTATFAFSRDACDGRSLPIPSSQAPWSFKGLAMDPLSSGINLEAGPACYDKVDNQIWAFANTSYVDPDHHFWSVDGSSGAVKLYNRKVGNPSFGSQWAAVAHDLRVALVSEQNTSKVWVIDLKNPGNGMTPIDTGTANDIGAGVVYHQPSRAILLWNENGSSLRKLSIPSNPLGSGYSWSTVNAAGGNSVTPSVPDSDYRGTYSKFNIIEDMGNGQSALVLVTSTKGPVYVYKLPKGALA